jgi:D-beta-D-heptose 7-phosphate kinase / D-beta-D-heptose 1-phosphate adenosyltransferase
MLVFDFEKVKKRPFPFLKGQVFTNGVFDLLHSGHIHVFKECTHLAQQWGLQGHNELKVIVAVNGDESIRELKGDTRPIMSLDERVEILSSIRYIDYIIKFDTKSVLPVIEEVCPQFLVKGGTYSVFSDNEEQEIVGQKFVEGCGGTVINTSLCDGVSTTNIIERIKNG